MRSAFGAVGVAIPLVLLAEAEAQKQLGGPRGVVRLAYAELAYLAGTDDTTARKVAERWVDVGEMVDAIFEEYSFTARWRDWDRWQEPRASPLIQAAVEFLRDVLGHGAQSTIDVERLAAEAGIATRTLERARSTLGVVPSRVGPRWVLSLPDAAKTAKTAATATQVEEEEEEEALNYVESEPSTEGTRKGEVAALCALLAATVRKHHGDDARVAPDGQVWRDACARLVSERGAHDVEQAIIDTAGAVRSMPKLGEWMRAESGDGTGTEARPQL